MNTTGVARARVSPSDDIRSTAASALFDAAGALGVSTVPGKKVAGGLKTFEAAISVLERVADFIVVFLGVFAVRAVYNALHLGKHLQYPFYLEAGTASMIGLLFIYLMDWDGGYQRGNSLLRIRETERILRVAMKAFLFVIPVKFVSGQLFSRWLLLLALAIVPVFLMAEKQLFWQCVRWMHVRGHGVENVLIYGAAFTGRKVFSALARLRILSSISVKF